MGNPAQARFGLREPAFAVRKLAGRLRQSNDPTRKPYVCRRKSSGMVCAPDSVAHRPVARPARGMGSAGASAAKGCFI